MLKKLVKYGNSTALILEKPLLELMGMEEGSFVKISTNDGKSLIITPVPHSQSVLNLKDAIKIGIENEAELFLEQKYGKELATAENIKLYQYFVEKYKTYFSDLMTKHNAFNLSEKFMSDVNYQKEVADLGLKYNPISHKKEYVDELIKIRQKYCPEIKQYDDAMRSLTDDFEKDFENAMNSNGLNLKNNN